MGRITVAIIVSLWVIPISILVNRIVPDPYMDEIFHIPQTQQYCKGNFRSWDPMITTPPGLYFLSLAHIASLFPALFSVKVAASFLDACSASLLRSANGVLAVVCSVLFYDILMTLRPALGDRKATISAVVFALYPLHWFFTFLYYTDVTSLTIVLAAYLISLKKNFAFSAALGALAVLIRQTTIIWVIFVACAGIIDCTLSHGKEKHMGDTSLLEQKDDQSVFCKSFTKRSNLRKRKSSIHEDALDNTVHSTGLSTLSSSGFFDEIMDIIFASWKLKWELIASFSPFFVVLMAFAAFVCWNGSIVLGAKEAHTVSPHFAQLFYYSLVSALFTAPMHFTFCQAATLARLFWKNKMRGFLNCFIALTAGFLSVHFFSIAHPYLLADNRHYTFYLWRRAISSHWSAKYLLVPLYVYSWFSIFYILAKSQRRTWLVLYFLACTATLVPAPLIEFRYYTIPFFFLILHMNVSEYKSLLLTGMLYVVINAFTMYMFLFRPFSWEHEAGTQRFIW